LNSFYGWGGAGGSLAQFSPKKNAAFAYTVTGFAPGLIGDFRSVEQIIPSLPKEFLD